MRKLIFASVAIAAMLGVAGCSNAAPQEPATTETSAPTAVGDGNLVFGAVLAHSTLDPDKLLPVHMAQYTAPLYDSLFLLNGDETVEGLLATEWESGSDAQGDFLDISLREGLSFPDGTAFTSATVKANIERSTTLEGSTLKAALAGVTVEELDTHKARVRNPAGVGAMVRVLSGPAGQMISDKAITDGADLTATAAGIGPYLLKSVEPNRVVYEANTDYWDQEAVGSETLEIVFLADDARLNAVRAGEIDITVLPPKMVATAEGVGYSTQSFYGAENYSFSVNTTMAPFDDPMVREAINLAVDREGMCEAIFGGACVASGQFFSVGTTFADKNIGLKNFPYDVEKAKKLIEDAGATGAQFEIVTVAGLTAFEQMATTFQAQLKEIGLDATVSPVSPPQVVGMFGIEKTAAVAFGAIGNDYDPSLAVEKYLLPKGLYNPGGFEDARLVEMAAEGLKEADQAKRADIYREMSVLAQPSGFFIPLLVPETFYVISPEVSGWQQPWAPSFPNFRGVSG